MYAYCILIIYVLKYIFLKAAEKKLCNKYTAYRQKQWATYRSCAALETQAMKLPAHSSFADVNFRGGLNLCIPIYCKS